MFPYIQFPDLTEAERKRRALLDPTQNYNYDTSIPNSLPQPSNPVISTIPQQGGGRMALIGNILNAIAAGGAVALSDNPGQALTQQLMSQRQAAMQKQQLEYQRQNQESQRAFEKQQQQTQIQAQKEAQQSEHEFKKAEGASAEDFTLKRDSIKFLQDQTLQKNDFEARAKAQQISQLFQAGEAQKNRDWQNEFEKIKSTNDITNTEVKQLMAALLSTTRYRQSAPVMSVLNLVDKVKNNEALTKEDGALIDHQMKLMNIGQGGGGGGSTKLNQKFQQKSYLDLQNDENDIIKGIILKDKTPVINPQTGDIVKDFNGHPIMQNSSPEEIAQKVRDGVALFRSVTGYKQQQEQHIQQQINPQSSNEITAGELQVMTNINNFLDQGYDPSAIDVSKLPANLRQQVQNRINMKKNKFKPKGF